MDYGAHGVNSHFDQTESINMIAGIISDTNQELAIIFDNQWLQTILNNPLIISNIEKLKFRNLPVKSIIEITMSNTFFSKKLMKYSEVRHSDIAKGCTVINEKEYFFNYYSSNIIDDSTNCFVNSNDDLGGHHQHHQLFHFKNEYFINQQRLLFESLWKDSILATQKITELERHVIEEIINPQELVNFESSKQIIFRIIESSVDQILILVPSINLFWNLYYSELFKLISQTISRYLTVRILLLSKDNQSKTQYEIRRKLKELSKELDFNTNFLSKVIRQEYISLIVDNAVMIELHQSSASDVNNDSADKSSCPTNMKILAFSFSTSEDKISTASTIFDTLWVQSDMDRQKKIRQTYFDIFKGFNLKSENYMKDWKSKESPN